MARTELASPSDEQCVKAAIDGDRDAFGILVERYWRMACGLALPGLGDPHAAEDIAQESFLAAWNYLPSLRRPERFAGWLATIVSHRRIDHLRSLSTRPLITASGRPSFLTLPAPAANPGLTEDELHLVRSAVASLPEKLRLAVVMRFVGGLTGREIAEKTGKSHATVRMWLHRAYKRLRRQLAPLCEEVK